MHSLKALPHQDTGYTYSADRRLNINRIKYKSYGVRDLGPRILAANTCPLNLEEKILARDDSVSRSTNKSLSDHHVRPHGGGVSRVMVNVWTFLLLVVSQSADIGTPLVNEKQRRVCSATTTAYMSRTLSPREQGRQMLGYGLPADRLQAYAPNKRA